MLITHIELTNFKCHTNSSFDLGKVNHFFGDNYVGKSSIGEAIVFCLFGVTKHGHKTYVKDYLQVGKSSMKVQMKLVVNKEEYEIVRTMNSKGTTKVFIGNQEADEKTVNQLIGGNFQSYTYCFFPEIFPEEEKNTARSFLIENIIQNKNDLDEYDQEKNRIQKQQKSVNSSITFYEGQKAVLKKQLEAIPSNQGDPIPPQENLTEKKKQLQWELSSIQTKVDELIQEGSQHKAHLVTCKEKLQELEATEQATNEYCPTCHQKLPDSQLHSVRLINQEKKSKLHVQIQGLVYKLEVEKREYQELSRKKALLETEVKDLESRYPSHPQNEMAIQQLNEVEKTLHELKEKKNSLAQELKQIKHLMGELANHYQGQINQNLLDTRITLFKQLKNGEYRPDFQITYKARPYRILSTSEKVRCMLEIIHIINRNTNYPLFLDNLESITHLHAPETQVITATVKKGTPLTLKIKV